MLEQRFIEDIKALAQRGNPTHLRSFDPSQYADRVPASLMSIWEQFGVASWLDGVFQTCDPATYATALDDVLKGNTLVSAAESTPFILSAYGIMKVWHRCLGTFQIQFPLGRIIFPRSLADLLAKQQGDINLISRWPTREAQLASITGYQQDRARLGRLGENEVYGFFPALALGGGTSPDQVKRVQADVHLDFLAGLQPFRTLYFDGSGYRDVE